MKKIVISLFALIIACPAFATVDIVADAETANCNNTTLHTYDGPTSLEADWTANTITLNWYNDNEKITPNNNTANTCTYDGAITLPTNNPTKDGYTFAGWQVRASLFDLSTLAEYINISVKGIGWKIGEGEWEVNTEEYGLDDNQWAKEFSYGTIKGISKCSSNEGVYHQAGTPADTNGEYCWCQVSGFASPNSNTYQNVATPSWVFLEEESGCSYWCVFECANANDVGFLAQLYGISQ